MKVIDIEWACGCCHTPPLDYAEISLADGMLSITTDHRDDIDAYTVRKYGADNRLIEENEFTADEADAYLAGQTLRGVQIYAKR